MGLVITMQAVVWKVHIQHEVIIIQLSGSPRVQVVQDILRTEITGKHARRIRRHRRHITSALQSLCLFVTGQRCSLCSEENISGHHRPRTKTRKKNLNVALKYRCGLRCTQIQMRALPAINQVSNFICDT